MSLCSLIDFRSRLWYKDEMLELEPKQNLPLTIGKDGTIRVAGSRVSLDSILAEFKRGATPEQIQEDFPSLALRDIYAAIAYYLSNCDSLEAYLKAQQREATGTRAEIDSHQDTTTLRERLRKHRSESVR